MKKYYKILQQEYYKCLKHGEKYKLNNYNALCNNSYNAKEDAKLCTYYYIKDNFIEDSKLINFAKDQL